MKYVEKALIDPVPAPDLGSAGWLMRLPGFVITWTLRRKLEAIRADMGGDSRDIVAGIVHHADHRITGYDGDVRLRVYTPDGAAIRPVLLFHHGGGFFGGTVEAVEHFCRAVADRADAVVVSVDYHLAPEHPFPHGVEDAYAALRWVVDHADELGIDANRVSVGGDSAGGNLAAVMSILAIERGDLRIHRQVLIYPVVDSTLANARTNHPEAPHAVRGLLGLYVDDIGLNTDPRVSPVTYERTAELPPTLIAVGDHDPLFGQDEAYAEQLDAAGVDVEFHRYRYAEHAFIDDVGNDPNADDLVAETARFIG